MHFKIFLACTNHSNTSSVEKARNKIKALCNKINLMLHNEDEKHFHILLKQRLQELFKKTPMDHMLEVWNLSEKKEVIRWKLQVKHYSYGHSLNMIRNPTYQIKGIKPKKVIGKGDKNTEYMIYLFLPLMESFHRILIN